jgi:uncharacterized protein YigE (DUF2233 family)
MTHHVRGTWLIFKKLGFDGWIILTSRKAREPRVHKTCMTSRPAGIVLRVCVIGPVLKKINLYWKNDWKLYLNNFDHI